MYDILKTGMLIDPVSRWLKVESNADTNIAIARLVGNKSDLDHLRAVPTEGGQAVC